MSSSEISIIIIIIKYITQTVIQKKCGYLVIRPSAAVIRREINSLNRKIQKTNNIDDTHTLCIIRTCLCVPKRKRELPRSRLPRIFSSTSEISSSRRDPRRYNTDAECLTQMLRRNRLQTNESRPWPSPNWRPRNNKHTRGKTRCLRTVPNIDVEKKIS